LAIELQAPLPSRQEKSKAEDILLTSMAWVASRNWKFTFLSDSLMAESLLSSTRVKLFP
jgi:hypothetical protein